MPAGRKGVAQALDPVTPITQRLIFPKVHPLVSACSAFSP
jgi:hypothetical protein